MNNSDPLVTFGIAVCIVAGLFIVIPFLRGKSDIPTAWNCLLLGLIIFTGLGSIEVKYVSSFSYEQLNWFQPTVQEIRWYMWATTAFIVTLIAAYYLNTPAKHFTQRRLQKWPEFDAPLAFFVMISCLCIVVVSFVVGRFIFFGPAFFKLGHKAAVFACVFSFMLWNRNRVNVSWLVLFFGVLLTAMIYCMLVSPGRRLVMSIFLGPILCLYWTQVRYWKPTKIIIAMALAGFVILSVSVVYSKFRWYSLTAGEKRSVQGLISQMKDVRVKGDYFSVFTRGRLSYFGQQNGHFALLTQRYVAQGALTPSPLNSLQFLASYPIPRRVWPGKPEVVGLTVVRDVAHIPGTNWGLGIAGQGIYEGGIPALVLYAILLAFLARLFDEPLKSQPDNPFLIAMHAAALPHIVGIVRGDMGIMAIESIECLLFAVLLGFVTRAIFGSGKRYTNRAANSVTSGGYPVPTSLRYG
jgi:hypothetical protein